MSGSTPASRASRADDPEVVTRHEAWSRRARHFRELADASQGPFTLVFFPLAARFCQWRAGR